MRPRTPQKQAHALAEVAEWDWQFGQVAEFMRLHGHCDLGMHPAADWVRRQRTAAMLGKLSPERQQRLSDLGIRLVEDDASWNTTLERLREWSTRQNAGKENQAAQPSGDPDEPTLLAWLSDQQLLSTAGKLSADQQLRLAQINLVPARQEKPPHNTRHTANWELRYGQLVGYKLRFGHCDVPLRCPENPDLDRWVTQQRGRNRKKVLHPQRFRQLDALGFPWTIESRVFVELWESRFTEMAAYQKEHGHTRVPKSFDKRLWHWRHVQREFRRKGMLSAERIARLDAIGFEWERPGRNGRQLDVWRRERWDEFFTRLSAFKDRFGHCQVPAEWREDRELASWISDQRKIARQGRMIAERRQRLDEIGFVWKASSRCHLPPFSSIRSPSAKWLDLWETRFAEIAAFQKEHGHTRVPKAFDKRLWHWRHVQREFRRKGMVRADRIARLDAIGFEWEGRDPVGGTTDDFQRKRWDDFLARLAAFKVRFGHCQVPKRWPEDQKLARWVAEQRKCARSGELPADRKQRLGRNRL